MCLRKCRDSLRPGSAGQEHQRQICPTDQAFPPSPSPTPPLRLCPDLPARLSTIPTLCSFA
eukprot:756871-Hanusia_phi.AAC.1